MHEFDLMSRNSNDEKQLQDIDNSFNALLIVITVVQIGVSATILALPYSGVIPPTQALLQSVSDNIIRSIFDVIVPIIVLAVCWWGGSFFENLTHKLFLKLVAWFLLFSQVVYSVNIILTQFEFPNSGYILLISGLSAPLVSLVFLYSIRKRYQKLTGISVKWRYLAIACGLFIGYWIWTAFISTTPHIVS